MLHRQHHIPPSSHADLPMSRGCYEVQTAVDSVVWHGPAVDPRLCIQEVLTLTVNVVYDRLPAEETEKTHQAKRQQDNKEHKIIWESLSSSGKCPECANTAHQLLLSTASPNPGVSTIVSVSWTPPSLISTLDCST